MQSNTFKWRNYSIKTKMRVAVLLPMTALLLSCVLIGLLFSQQKNANQWVIHTFEVRLAVATLRHQFSTAEACLKTYVALKTPAAQSAAKAALADSQRMLAKIRELTADNASQQQRIAQTDSLLASCTKFVDASSANGPSLAEGAAKVSITVQIEKKITEMDEEELGLLGSRTDRTGKLQDLMTLVIAGTILIGVLGSLFGIAVLSNNILRRVLQLLHSSLLMAEGLNVKSLDTSKDELGRLASALAQTSRVLSERAGEITEINWKLESVLRSAISVSIIAEDSNGRISLFSAGASKLLGYRADEVMNRSLKSTLQEQSASADNNERQRNTNDYETTYLRKDGHRLDVHVSITPLKNIAGKVTGYLHVAHDITPRKLLEAELRNKVDRLQSGEQPSADEAADETGELPEWLRANGANNAEQLSSKLRVLNDWYENAGPIPNPNQDQSAGAPHILIVDDFEATRALLRAYLKDEGYWLDFASNGKEALDCVSTHRYDLILMDVDMPEMDGYEAAKRIRDWETSQARPPVPIVALTAHNQTEAPTVGVWTSYVQKPLSKIQLLDEVKGHLKAKVA